MDGIKALFLIVICFFLTAVGTVAYYYYVFPVEVWEEDISLKVVSSGVSFNVETDAIKLGALKAGTHGKRFLNIHNEHEFPVEVMIEIKGNVKPLISLSHNDFVLQPDGDQRVEVIGRPDESTSTGQYEGKMRIEFRKA